MLDPGSFDPVTITTAITIDGNGIAAILSSGTDGIVVNAGVNDKVVIRNISINGAGTTLGLNGIRYLAGKTLAVENVTLQNFSSRGIDIALAAAGNPSVKDVSIKDVRITKAQTGIRSVARLAAGLPHDTPGSASQDCFCEEVGPYEEMLPVYGLDAAGIISAAKRAIDLKERRRSRA